ncbi:hypothetical protein NQ318_001463 [Aromia moschata]|uniref:Lysosome-associated membrane glycoprotein 5 n=1 Tax=Aromia moschata TaxID=1265417 RepID=A0AAV8YVU2_9CUCU|nr:hypothetical protein NQ318_001463 [Aromia moschata]
MGENAYIGSCKSIRAVVCVSVPPEPPQPVVNTTVAPPTTGAPTTAAPTTSSTKPTTPTAPPTATTKPSPTTQPSTTTTSTTTTKTPPTTPTPAPTTSTPAPTPVDPTVGNWTVDYANSNRTCLILQAAIQYEILGQNATTKINVPQNATVTGSCGDQDQLVLNWAQNNSLQLDFLKLKSKKYELGDIVTTINATPQGLQVYNLVYNGSAFSAPVDNSYKCARVQTLNLTEPNSNVTVAYLHVSQLQYQPFMNKTEHKFDSAVDCESSDTTPDVVPIVVGCVLAALVVMVLVAYLVGRRRCQARGYLSMFAETKTEADYVPMKRLSCFN